MKKVVQVQVSTGKWGNKENTLQTLINKEKKLKSFLQNNDIFY